MAIPPDETEIVGRWSEIHGEVQPDAECRRIERLIDTELEQLTAALDGGWDTLYRDPGDDRLWECVYEDSSFHGAGPPTLRVISRDAAAEKYGWGDDVEVAGDEVEAAGDDVEAAGDDGEDEGGGERET